MARFYPPGTRRGNRTYVIRGCVDGQQHEIRTPTTQLTAAQRFWKDHVSRLKSRRILPGTPVSLQECAALYCEARGLGRRERQFVAKIVQAIGSLNIRDVKPMDIANAANRLYPGALNSTKNRAVYVPTAAILHYATENDLRPYLKVRKLREDRPRNRRPLEGSLELLLANTEGAKRALLIFLFAQGWRITEVLRLRWEHVRLATRELEAGVGKARAWKTVEMHPDVYKALSDLPHRSDGYVFGWRVRQNVYRWLRPLCARLDIKFTPHMARHEFATQLHDRAHADGADLVMVGTWTSERSTSRYVETSRERAQALIRAIDFREVEKDQIGRNDAKRPRKSDSS